MLSGDQCNGVSELAEGHSYIRGRCKQLGNLYSPNRDDGHSVSCSDYEFLIPKDEFASPVDAIEKQSEDICRRVSMTPGDLSNDHVAETPIDDTDKLSIKPIDRRLSRDIGIQAFSLDIEEEKEKVNPNETKFENEDKKIDRNDCMQREAQHKCTQSERFCSQREHRPSIFLRRDSCHFHKLVSPQNEIIMAHCSSTTPVVMEFTDSFDTYKSLDVPGSNFIELTSSDECTKRRCSCYDHYHGSIDSTEQGGHRYSTCSSDSSTTITKFTAENSIDTARRPNKWKSSLVYFMDPCIEDATENAPDGEYNENEQTKPLLEQHHQQQRDTITTAYEKSSNNYRKKNSDDSIKQRAPDVSTVRNVEGIELANDAVCPFGLAKNLEKQICIIPSRKKKSSGRPSCLKLITLILIGSAILITSAAIKEALMTKRGN